MLLVRIIDIFKTFVNGYIYIYIYIYINTNFMENIKIVKKLFFFLFP